MPREEAISAFALGAVLALTSCAAGQPEVSADSKVVVETTSASLTGSLLEYANGTYGSSCSHYASQSWSVPINNYAGALPNSALAVVMNNGASCVLTLTSLVTSESGGTTYAASPSIALGTSYAGTASTFSSGSGTAFYGNAMLSSVSFAANFTLNILFSDNPKSTNSGSLGTGYATVSASASSTGSNSPTYTLDLTTGAFAAAVNDATDLVQSVSGTANLVLGSIAGTSYYVDQGNLPSNPTFAQLDSAYPASPTTILNGTNPVQIAASAFGLTGVNLSSAAVRTIVVQLSSSGVPSYQTFAVTFNCTGTCGVCPSGESSKADSSGNGAAKVCCPSAANYLNCNGVCVNDQTDDNNCGACGTACNTWQGEVCSAGRCGACRESSNNLSGIGTGDFSISFTLTDTHTTGTERAIINQRNFCGVATFWDLRMSSQGYLYIETDDSTHDLQLTPSVLMENNGSHSIVVNRTSEILFALIDGNPVAWGSSLANWSGNLPALSYSDVCDSSNTVTSVANLCINPGAPPPIQNGTYELLNPNWGYALDDEGSSGTLVDQVVYTGTTSNQNWTVTLVEGGTNYKIMAANGLALTGSSSGGQLTLASWAAASDQLWTFVPNSIQSGTNATLYNIINASTGQAIDSDQSLSNNPSFAGYKVIQNTWSTTSTNQTWVVINRSSLTQPIANGTYSFINEQGNGWLNNPLANPNYPNQASCSNCSSGSPGTDQQWNVTQVSGLEYSIISAASGSNALTALSSGDQNNLAALSTFSSSNTNQLWVFEQIGASSYVIMNVGQGVILDANGGGTATCHQWNLSQSEAASNSVWTLMSP